MMSPARIAAFSAGLPGRTPLILAPGSADSPKSGTTPKAGAVSRLCAARRPWRLGSRTYFRGSRGSGRRRDDAGGEGGDKLEASRVELVPVSLGR